MYENGKRSLIKAISWRFIATLTTFLLVFIFTGKINLAIEIGFLDFTIKLTVYYLHERFWNKINWQRQSSKKDKSI